MKLKQLHQLKHLQQIINKILYSQNPFGNGRVFCLALFLLIYSRTHAQAFLKIEDNKKNFGFVKKGEVVTLEFLFENTGNQPLIISDIKVECSCTSVEYPKQPIAPGQKDKIIVKFDTKSTYDRQDRALEIISNSKNNPQKIRFKGVVLKS